GRSESPLGPFTDRDGRRLDEGYGTLLLEGNDQWKGTGHNGVFQTTTPDGSKRDWLILAAYDAERPELGRLTQIRPLMIPMEPSGWPEAGEIHTIRE
ncbi:MAG: hypothetical protein Q4C47_08855, partial [Planctomycetia bacterium]|nr:hypothetical protein [Planctomycetia bacterium]